MSTQVQPQKQKICNQCGQLTYHIDGRINEKFKHPEYFTILEDGTKTEIAHYQTCPGRQWNIDHNTAKGPMLKGGQQQQGQAQMVAADPQKQH